MVTLMGKSEKPYADGCSGFMSYLWRTLLGHPPPWEGLCDAHDKAYERGGPLWDRVVADWHLAVGVWKLLRAAGRWDFWLWSSVMFVAVRVGGVWWIPFPTLLPLADGTWEWNWTSVRWGYSHRFPFYQEGQTVGQLVYPRIITWAAVLAFLA